MRGAENAAYDRLRWQVLRAFGALPSEDRVKAMEEADYLWCARNLAMDGEEALSRLCPACRQKAMEERCPVCGAQAGDQGVNQDFDLERFRQLQGTATAQEIGETTAERAGEGDLLPVERPAARAEDLFDQAEGLPVQARGPEELLRVLRKVRAGEELLRGAGHALTVTLPELPAAAPGWSVDDLDRAVERDARRYDGGFLLY